MIDLKKKKTVASIKNLGTGILRWNSQDHLNPNFNLNLNLNPNPKPQFPAFLLLSLNFFLTSVDCQKRGHISKIAVNGDTQLSILEFNKWTKNSPSWKWTKIVVNKYSTNGVWQKGWIQLWSRLKKTHLFHHFQLHFVVKIKSIVLYTHIVGTVTYRTLLVFNRTIWQKFEPIFISTFSSYISPSTSLSPSNMRLAWAGVNVRLGLKQEILGIQGGQGGGRWRWNLILTLDSPHPPKWTPRCLSFDSNVSLIIDLVNWTEPKITTSYCDHEQDTYMIPSSHSWEVDSAESAATTSSREQRWELRLKLGQSRPGADLAHLVWRHPWLFHHHYHHHRNRQS